MWVGLLVSVFFQYMQILFYHLQNKNKTNLKSGGITSTGTLCICVCWYTDRYLSLCTCIISDSTRTVWAVCHCTMYLCIQIDLRREVGGGGQNKKHQAACNNNITVVTFKLLPITVASAVHFFFFYPVPTTNESCPHRLPGQCLHWLPSNQDARPFCQWSVHICCGGEVSLLRIGTIYQWSSLSQSKS